jgi:hypothetical protein
MKHITLLLCLVSYLPIYGHVSFAESYTGKTYFVGQNIQIQWKALVVHDPENWDLLFSSSKW